MAAVWRLAVYNSYASIYLSYLGVLNFAFVLNSSDS
jgi:hypothetical protein